MSTILVTGGAGMVGMELRRYNKHFVFATREQCDLSKEGDVNSLFDSVKPDIVIHLAARVGGIVDNLANPFYYLTQNLVMDLNVIRACHSHKVNRFMGMLSTCAYPDTALKYPLDETDLFESRPAASNMEYGYAKRMLALAVDSCNRQFGLKYSYLIPCNMYGPYDRYDDGSHFVAALIKKMHNAKITGADYITLYGTGKPLRQFMFARDLARIIMRCIRKDIFVNMNVAVPEYSIDEIARIALKTCGLGHVEIRYDPEMPDGQFRKTASPMLLYKTLPDFKFTSLEEGIKVTFDYYEQKRARD